MVETLDLEAEQAADYRIVELAGGPATIGAHHASYLTPVPTSLQPWPWERDEPFLAACATIVDDVAPWLSPELSTFAEQAGIAPAQGLFIRAGALNHGCSAVVWRASNGHIMVGRTYDFYIRMRTRHLLITNPDNGARHIGMNGGLVGGRYDGVNEHGVFIAVHKVMADKPTGVRPGVPYHLIPRIVLQGCRTAAEAADLIQHVPHLAPFNYTVADASGAMIALECYPGRRVERRESDTMLAVTNHYTAPTLRAVQGRRSLDASCQRKATLETVSGDDPWWSTVAVLSDHDAAICCHREFSTTLWAGLFDLTARRVAYSFGAPCRNPFRCFAFPGGAA